MLVTTLLFSKQHSMASHNIPSKNWNKRENSWDNRLYKVKISPMECKNPLLILSVEYLSCENYQNTYLYILFILVDYLCPTQ